VASFRHRPTTRPGNLLQGTFRNIKGKFRTIRGPIQGTREQHVEGTRGQHVEGTRGQHAEGNERATLMGLVSNLRLRGPLLGVVGIPGGGVRVGVDGSRGEGGGGGGLGDRCRRGRLHLRGLLSGSIQ
jgi:hypothetical protein